MALSNLASLVAIALATSNGDAMFRGHERWLSLIASIHRKANGCPREGDVWDSEDDGRADAFAGGCGERGNMGTAHDGTEDDDCMYRTICSCLAARCSRLRRTMARSRAMSSCCRTNSGEVALADAFVGITSNNLSIEGAKVLTISFASSPWDCQASVAPTPSKTAMKKREMVRNILRPIDGRLCLGIR